MTRHWPLWAMRGSSLTFPLPPPSVECRAWGNPDGIIVAKKAHEGVTRTGLACENAQTGATRTQHDECFAEKCHFQRLCLGRSDDML
jgi:hypothetical protein